MGQAQTEVRGHWIGGRRYGAGSDAFSTENPANGEILGHFAQGGSTEVERAVGAARSAQGAWAEIDPRQRGDLLRRISDELERNSDDLAVDVTRDIGIPLKLSKVIQVGLPISVFRDAANLAETYSFEEILGSSRVLIEPVGVVGCITPWNFPLHQATSKVSMALAVGCTVVLKPSELAPMCIDRLIDATQAAGLPSGVFNVVWGGGLAGGSLAGSSGVDMLSFTGSPATGSRVAEAAARNLKRTGLELGGKSASIVLPGANLERAVKSTVTNCFLNSGQVCYAWTRLLVERRQLARAAEIAESVAATFKVGDPFDPDVKMGPLISEVQRRRVLEFIEQGRQSAKLVCGGGIPKEMRGSGYFIEPTVFTDVDPSSAIAQQEIFGPVLSIIGYDTIDGAVEIANDTDYGLGGAVFAADISEAELVARRLRTGQVDLNGGKYNRHAPFGGVKKSGYGREMGIYGFREFTESKSLQY